MSVYKDGNKWRVIYRYTDSRGERKQTQKRGFSTKKEAQAWEREQMNKTESSLDMTFESFSEIYFEDMKKRLKDNTWHTKEHILRTKLIPFFGKRKMCDIQPKDVIGWQNEMLEGSTKTGKPYSPVYLKTLHNQLSAIFNYAVKFYGLPSNPAAKAGNMGKAKNREMLFWTQEEYKCFAEVMMDKPISFYAFEMLYWCGIREGELLALTPADFDFEKQTVSITKSYQRIKGQDIITDPKTQKSNRVVKMPDFLSQEIQDFIGQLYGIGEHDRMFMITKSYLHHEMDRGAKESGVKRIRIHDLRHSHISLLIEMGFSAVAIADRVGHESIDITYRYLILFNAVVHMDESTPHLHLDFVPMSDEARKNGMRVRNSLTGALRQQGHTGTGLSRTITIDWLEREKEHIGQLMLEHGIEWVKLGTHEKHKSVSRFKADKLREEIEQKTSELGEVQQELDKAAKKKLKIVEIESIEAKESMFGKKVTLSKEDYDKLNDTAKKYVAMEKNTKKLKKERDTAVQERDKLKAKYDATASELAGYKKKEEEAHYFSRKKLNDSAKRISKEEQLTRSLQKALTVIDAHGLRDEYNHTKLNTAQRKTVLE